MRLEMGHPQDDRSAIWRSQTNPSLSATIDRHSPTICQFELANLANNYG
jgi:hypothetical protein